MSQDQTWFGQPKEFTLRHLAYYIFVFGVVLACMIFAWRISSWVFLALFLVVVTKLYSFLRTRQKLREPLVIVLIEVMRTIFVSGMVIGILLVGTLVALLNLPTFAYFPVIGALFGWGGCVLVLIYRLKFRHENRKLKQELPAQGWDTPVRRLIS